MSRTRSDQAAPIPAPRYGSVAAMAVYSGLSQKTVRNLIDAGELRAHKIGRRILISYTDFDDYINNKPR